MEVDGEDSDAVLERQLSASVRMTLFDEQPAYLNAFFRFQLGSNTFDGGRPLQLAIAKTTGPGCGIS
jgi:hypothetical protein